MPKRKLSNKAKKKAREVWRQNKELRDGRIRLALERTTLPMNEIARRNKVSPATVTALNRVLPRIRMEAGALAKITPERLANAKPQLPLAEQMHVRIMAELIGTRKSMRQIAKETGAHYKVVLYVNKRQGIRDRVESHQIGSEGMARRKSKRKRFDSFDSVQKHKLLKKHTGIIVDKTAPWFWGGTMSSELIREEYGTHKRFIQMAVGFMFKELDFFDPGRKIKHVTWIGEGAELFCKKEASRLVTADKKNSARSASQMPEGMDGQISVDAIEKAVRGEGKRYKAFVPKATRSFLGNLGLPKERTKNLSEQAFQEIRQALLEVINDRGTGLSPAQMVIARLRLEGTTMEQIGKQLGVERQNIEQHQNRAVPKIRKALTQMSRVRKPKQKRA